LVAKVGELLSSDVPRFSLRSNIMSVFISHWRFGDWTCKLKKPCFITVGYPLRGFEELGLVKSYSERNARLDTVSTERPCLATIARDDDAHGHDLVWRPEDIRIMCSGCSLVVMPGVRRSRMASRLI
jgi:hypothetical protein